MAVEGAAVGGLVLGEGVGAVLGGVVGAGGEGEAGGRGCGGE